MSDLNFIPDTYLETVFCAMRINCRTGEYILLKRPQDEDFLNIPLIGNIDHYAKVLAKSDLIYAADKSDFKEYMTAVSLRRFMRSGKSQKVFSYRRRMGNRYLWMSAEFMISSAFSEDNPYILYTLRLADNESRFLRDVMRMLSGTYYKIVKMNLSDDTHQEIKMYYDAMETDYGLSVRISEWFKKYAEGGNVYPEDLEAYHNFTSIHRLRMHFRHSKETLQLIYRRKVDDEFRWVSMEIMPSVEYTPDNQVLILFMQDIHDRYTIELQWKKDVEYYKKRDILTGFFNRLAYQDVCREYAQKSEKTPVTVVFADMNGLRYINDTLGSEAGDTYIQSFANVLSDFFGQEFCYRINGDEFVVILFNQTKKDSLPKLREFQKKVHEDCAFHASVGFSWATKANQLEEIVRDAERSMYVDKNEYYRHHPRYAF